MPRMSVSGRWVNTLRAGGFATHPDSRPAIDADWYKLSVQLPEGKKIVDFSCSNFEAYVCATVADMFQTNKPVERWVRYPK